MTKIQKEINDKKTLELNAYDVRIDADLVKNKDLIDTILFECHLAILLVDITNKDSFELIKDLTSILPGQNQFFKVLLVLNKFDLDKSRVVTDYEIQEFIKSNNNLDSLNISIKTGENIDKLINIIDTAVNNPQSDFALNNISLSLNNKVGSENRLTFILIGDSSVGKTSMAGRYFKNQFSDEFISTIGINKEIKIVKIADETIRINLWDTAGQERFNKALPKTYYQNSDGVLLLFDVGKEDSFENVKKWMSDFEQNSSKNFKEENGKRPDVYFYLIGNKVDLPKRVISKERATEMAKSLGMKYFEISCKINLNIEEVMARMTIDCFLREKKVDSVFRLTTQKLEGKREGGCCGGGDKKKDNH